MDAQNIYGQKLVAVWYCSCGMIDGAYSKEKYSRQQAIEAFKNSLERGLIAEGQTIHCETRLARLHELVE